MDIGREEYLVAAKRQYAHGSMGVSKIQQQRKHSSGMAFPSLLEKQLAWWQSTGAIGRAHHIGGAAGCTAPKMESRMVTLGVACRHWYFIHDGQMGHPLFLSLAAPMGKRESAKSKLLVGRSANAIGSKRTLIGGFTMAGIISLQNTMYHSMAK